MSDENNEKDESNEKDENPTTLKDAVYNIFIGWCEGKLSLAEFIIRTKKLNGFYQKKKTEKEGVN
jgi:hypothetical protein